MAAMLYVRLPLSLRKIGTLLFCRGVESSGEMVRFWCHRFGPMFAIGTGKRRTKGMKSGLWRGYLNEMFAKINGELYQLWRVVDREGKMLERYVSKARDKRIFLKFLNKTIGKFARGAQGVTGRHCQTNPP